MFNKDKIFKLLKNKVITTLFLSLLSFSIFLFLIKSEIFYEVDKTLQNNFYKHINTLNNKVSDDLVVIRIDEPTIKKLKRFPFKRDVYFNVIKNLNNLGVSVIGFDIIFADETDKKIDNEFGKVIKDAGNVVLGSAILSGNFLEKPLDILLEGAVSYGYFRPNVDKRTEVVYTFTPKAKLRQGEFNSFSIALLKAYYYKLYNDDSYLKEMGNYNKYFFNLKHLQIPLARKNSKDVLIKYFPSSSFKSYSFIDLYDKNSEVYKKLENSGDLKGKIVVVGATAKGIKDVFFTPIGITYGVYTHINILNTILTKSYLTYFDKKTELLILFLFTVIGTYINLSRSKYVIIFSNLAILSLFIIILPTLLIVNNLILNYSIELFFSLILTITFSNIVKYLIENKNKGVLVKALSEYISEDIAKAILTDSGDLKLNGENKKISIFFSDIAGFTTISEKMSPEKLVEFLREYLGAMSNIIMDERGFINKYEGDAIMALYGVFGYEDTSTYDNCKAALLQQTKLKILNKLWEKQFGEILKVRMGIHTGNAIIGNIGAKGRKMEYTALGDSVNLASRLEGVNKFYGTYICVSENVVNEVGDKFEFRKLDKIRVKGKKIPIEIYELLGEKGKISDLKRDIKTGFEKALMLYFNKEFKKAGEIFKKLGEIGDPASLVFARRCFKFEISGVKEDWDGVWTMEDK